MKQIILSELVKNSTQLNIKYSCRTTSTNSEYVDIYIRETKAYHTDSDNVSPFVTKLQEAIEELKPDYPNLHIISKRVEFHFFFPGFDSHSSKMLPVTISNQEQSKEIQKTGKVSERYDLVGKSKAIELMDKYPDYELYKRAGYAFRGASESRTDREGVLKLCDWAAAVDIKVIDNEIHFNGFSCNDLY